MNDLSSFSQALYEKMQLLNPGIAELELYEFRYALVDLLPAQGWGAVALEGQAEIEAHFSRRAFYDRIQIKPRQDGRLALDGEIVRLAQMLFVGLVTGAYPAEWINAHFYFDIRGFFFLHRTTYLTERVLAHFGGAPYRSFEPKQQAFERLQDVGYKAFKEANAEVDALFLESVMRLIDHHGAPLLVAVAGATAAGKTEITERLRASAEQSGRSVTSIELDNFLTDRDEREAKGINSEGKAALHLALLLQALEDITSGKRITIPRYNFISAASSHASDGSLKPGGVPLEIEPADIIFMEGNFPFLLEEIAHRIAVKVVYLTDDPVRLKRKWKRDIDYRKKYDPTYFRNRYFKEQFIMAEVAYLPQLETCDIAVDTTGAALWVTPPIAAILREAERRRAEAADPAPLPNAGPGHAAPEAEGVR